MFIWFGHLTFSRPMLDEGAPLAAEVKTSIPLARKAAAGCHSPTGSVEDDGVACTTTVFFLTWCGLQEVGMVGELGEGQLDGSM